MAEFQEVMKQAKRMCDNYNDCTDCPICKKAEEAQTICPVPSVNKIDSANVETVVMDWAASHPEPRYPTWKEWQDTNFPNNDALMRPCIFESEEYFGCKLKSGCEECMNKPIPADIAEKLGIKPIGGSDNG